MDDDQADERERARAFLKWLTDVAELQSLQLGPWQRAWLVDAYLACRRPVDVPVTMAVFVCPRCSKASSEPNDVRERYCGQCHVFVDDAVPRAGLDRVWFDEAFGAGDGQAWVAPVGTPVPKSGRPPVWEPVGYVPGDALNVWGAPDRGAANTVWSRGWSAGHSTVRFEVVDVDERTLRLYYGAPLVVPLPWADDDERFALPCERCGPDHRRWTNGYRGAFGWSGLLRRASASRNWRFLPLYGEDGRARWHDVRSGRPDRRPPMRPVTEYGPDVLLDLAAVDAHQVELVRLSGDDWRWHLQLVLHERFYGAWGTFPAHGWGRGYGKGRRR